MLKCNNIRTFLNRLINTENRPLCQVSNAVAGEILNATTKQANGALSGRTINGIARELRHHYQGYDATQVIPYFIAPLSSAFSFVTIKVFDDTDIGGMDRNMGDYDYNAKGFENNAWGEVISEWADGKIKNLLG